MGHNSLVEAHFCKMMKPTVLMALTPSGQMLGIECTFINYLANKCTLILFTYFYCVILTNMFCPLICPTSGRFA
jgi:hypothetical protein